MQKVTNVRYPPTALEDEVGKNRFHSSSNISVEPKIVERKPVFNEAQELQVENIELGCLQFFTD